MSMSINQTTGVNAYQNMLQQKKEKEEADKKLSSGYQINSAADDASGLAISEKMRAEITANKAAQFNAATATGAVKVAEGAMQSVNDMLDRAKELSMSASNGTYSDSDRSALQNELTQLVDEINRVAQSTNYNGVEMLDGSLSVSSGDGMEFQIDASGLSSNNISVNVENISIDASQMDITTLEQAQEILATLEEFVSKITAERGDLGATQNRLDYTESNLSTMELYLQQAESEIRDTDVAKEASESNQASVNFQAATSVLEQAQKDKETILGFLGS